LIIVIDFKKESTGKIPTPQNYLSKMQLLERIFTTAQIRFISYLGSNNMISEILRTSSVPKLHEIMQRWKKGSVKSERSTPDTPHPNLKLKNKTFGVGLIFF